jgi:hypothetical protein
VAPEVVEGVEGICLVGDKAYSSPPLMGQLAKQGIAVVALRNRKWWPELPEQTARLIKSIRHTVETVGSQLTQVFHMERTLAKSTWGIKTRLVDKLLAHRLGFFLNLMMGRRPLQTAGLIY